MFRFRLVCAKCQHPIDVMVGVDADISIPCGACGATALRVEAAVGYVYVLSNADIPGLVKIGCTERPVEDRLAELNSATGVPSPFKVEAVFPTSNPAAAEKQIHESMQHLRHASNREFFRMPPDEAVTYVGQLLAVGSVGNGLGAKKRIQSKPEPRPIQFFRSDNQPLGGFGSDRYQA